VAGVEIEHYGWYECHLIDEDPAKSDVEIEGLPRVECWGGPSSFLDTHPPKL
jgi:hypothetical protein